MKIETLLKQRHLHYFYIMHLSWDGKQRRRLWNYAKQNKIIGLSHGNVDVDWEKASSRIKNSVSNIWKSQFDYFCSMEKGEIVVVMNGFDSILGVAVINKNQHGFDTDLNDIFFDHYREEVKWIREYEYDKRKYLKNPITFRNTLARIDEYSKRWSRLLTEEI